ncbi:MAG: hypothetical protein RIC87_10955 [Kiloniellales bacterium]
MSRSQFDRYLNTNAASSISEALSISRAADERALRNVDPKILQAGRRRRHGLFTLLLVLIGLAGIALGLWAVYLP